MKDLTVTFTNEEALRIDEIAKYMGIASEMVVYFIMGAAIHHADPKPRFNRPLDVRKLFEYFVPIAQSGLCIRDGEAVPKYFNGHETAKHENDNMFSFRIKNTAGFIEKPDGSGNTSVIHASTNEPKPLNITINMSWEIS